ncbi:MAG: hypothetical protein EP349_05895 [Alphaproteobacteria bacterium]|nr:MAG: hypothetical protein EP349_05895 [Alphaproteobacteria bacterium]
MGTKTANWDDETAQDILRKKATLPGALLPVLHDLQARFGYINADFVPEIADALNLSRADVHGVISFYHDFRDRPPSGKIVKICRAEACQSMGCHKLENPVQDGSVTVEPVYCLGNCACAPAVMIDGKTYGRVTPAKLKELLS